MTSLVRFQKKTRRARGFATGTALAGSLGLILATSSAQADAPSVVTTIKPLHSIASAVMDGVGSPHILVDGAASPHGFALKPSQAVLLQGADAVFWVGPELAPSLEKPIDSMASNAVTVELMDAAGIEHLAIREGANFDAHDHGDHDDHADHDDHSEHEEHADHDDHDHDEHEEAGKAQADEHDDHDHDEHAHADEHAHEGEKDGREDHANHDDHDHEKHEEHAEADHSDEHDHAHGDGKDVHIWLNPENGIAIAGVMAETLAKLDPDNAETYRKNAEDFSNRINQLEQDIAAELKPVKGKKFVVFHDAYHHFEHHFDIEASGSITLSPEALASADRVSKVQSQIKDLNVTCVFQEPQFDAKLVDVVIEGSNAQKGTLDPLGTDLANGPDLYPDLLKGLADSLSSCLAGQS